MRFLAGIRLSCYRPDKREVGSSNLPRPLEAPSVIDRGSFFIPTSFRPRAREACAGRSSPGGAQRRRGARAVEGFAKRLPGSPAAQIFPGPLCRYKPRMALRPSGLCCITRGQRSVAEAASESVAEAKKELERSNVGDGRRKRLTPRIFHAGRRPSGFASRSSDRRWSLGTRLGQCAST